MDSSQNARSSGGYYPYSPPSIYRSSVPPPDSMPPPYYSDIPPPPHAVYNPGESIPYAPYPGISQPAPPPYYSDMPHPPPHAVYNQGESIPYAPYPAPPNPYTRSVNQLARTDTQRLYNTHARPVPHPTACKKCNGTGTNRKGKPCKKCDENRGRGNGRGLGRGTMVARRGLGVGGFGFLGMIRRLFRGM